MDTALEILQALADLVSEALRDFTDQLRGVPHERLLVLVVLAGTVLLSRTLQWIVLVLLVVVAALLVLCPSTRLAVPVHALCSR